MSEGFQDRHRLEGPGSARRLQRIQARFRRLHARMSTRPPSPMELLRLSALTFVLILVVGLAGPYVWGAAVDLLQAWSREAASPKG